MPKLDTLILGAPLSWKNNLIQYAGRLHRPYKGKDKVKIFDYLDIYIPYLEKMYQKRQVAYKKMAYQLEGDKREQSLFDASSYEKVFKEDLQELQSSILLRINSFTSRKVYDLLRLLSGKKLEFQIPKEHRLALWLKGFEQKMVRVSLIDEKFSTNLLVIDENIVWYGSLSPLADNFKNDMNLLRLESQTIAREFLTEIDKKR